MTTRRITSVLFASAAVFLGACGSKATSSTANKFDGSTTTAVGATSPGAPTTLDDNGNGPRPSFDPALMKPYTDCMKENGVDVANIGRGGRGGGGGRNGQGDPNASSTVPAPTTTAANTSPTTTIDPAVFEAARTACADKRPAGIGGGGQGGPGGGQAMQAYRSCLKDNGVTLPDRGPGGQPGDFQPGDFQPGDFQPGDFQPDDFQPDDGSTPPTFPRNGATPDPNAPADANGTPGTPGGRAGRDLLGGLDQTDPIVKAAVEKCSVLLPQRPVDGATSTTVAA
jgi:hypothetical protein